MWQALRVAFPWILVAAVLYLGLIFLLKYLARFGRCPKCHRRRRLLRSLRTCELVGLDKERANIDTRPYLFEVEEWTCVDCGAVVGSTWEKVGRGAPVSFLGHG